MVLFLSHKLILAMRIIKSNGDSHDPCGVPIFIFWTIDVSSETSNICLLLFKYDCILFIDWLSNPYLCNFSNNIWWETVSKAEDKSLFLSSFLLLPRVCQTMLAILMLYLYFSWIQIKIFQEDYFSKSTLLFERPQLFQEPCQVLTSVGTSDPNFESTRYFWPEFRVFLGQGPEKLCKFGYFGSRAWCPRNFRVRSGSNWNIKFGFFGARPWKKQKNPKSIWLLIEDFKETI